MSKTTLKALATALCIGVALISTPNQVFAQKKKSKKSKKDKVELTEQQRMTVTSLFFDANNQKMLGNFQKAVELYQKCIQIDAKNDASYFELGQLALQAKDYQQAAIFFNYAYELKPENKWYTLGLATAFEKSQQFDKAIELYSKLLENEPNNIDYYSNLATAYAYSGNMKKAIEVYNQLEEKIGVDEQLSSLKQNMYLEVGDTDNAIKEAKKLIEKNPNEPEHIKNLVKLYTQANRKSEALEVLKKAETDFPQEGVFQLLVADFMLIDGKTEQAHAKLEAAFADPKLDIDLKIGTLLKYFEKAAINPQLKEETEKLNKILVATHPDSPKGYAMYADYLYRDGKLKEAKENYLKTIEFDNSKFLVWNQLLVTCLELNDYQSLANESERALELFPTQASIYFFNGYANLLLENTAKACEILELGSGLVYNNPSLKLQFYSTLGDALYKNNESSRAYRYYDKALQIDPKNIYVLNNYAYYLSLDEENLEKAKEMSGTTLEAEPNSPTYLDTYAWILYKLEDFTGAEKYFLKALENGGGSSAEIVEHYGDVLLKLNRNEEALNQWQKALELGPTKPKELEQKIADLKK